MYIGIIVFVALLIFVVVVAIFNRQKIKFTLEGLDKNFSGAEIDLLWQSAKVCGLSQPEVLYYSLPSLMRCITEIKSRVDGPESDNKNLQTLLAKLYDYRTSIQLEADGKKGLDSTRSLSNGQRLRIVLPGHGVFASQIVNNGAEMTISIPTQNGHVPVSGEDWQGKIINVYFWKQGDGAYVFDTQVMSAGFFLGHAALHLKQSDKLVRTQKRQSVRVACNIYAELFIITQEVSNYDAVETKKGYRCLLEDISESGALIRVAGKGVANIKLKLQFQLNDKLIIMFGVVRTVEYNDAINESKLHFECVHIDPLMKNNVLAYVYNILPQNEKEQFDAINQMSQDESGNEKTEMQSDEAKPAFLFAESQDETNDEKGEDTLEDLASELDEAIKNQNENNDA